MSGKQLGTYKDIFTPGAPQTNGAENHADEAAHWNTLIAIFPASRANHSEAYSANGSCTNQVESYFSRLRRMIAGQHRHIMTATDSRQ